MEMAHPVWATAAILAAACAALAGLSISCTGGGGPAPASVSVADISINNANVSFGSQPVDTTSPPQTVTMTNSGNALLTITSIQLTGPNAGDFALNNTCGNSVAAGANCNASLTFTPFGAGTRTASLVVTDNSNNVMGSTQMVSLTGTGAHDVVLAWTASSTVGVTGYYAYRGLTSSGETSTPLNCVFIAETSCADTGTVSGTTYYYVVVAIASDGVTLSEPSNEASVVAE